MSAEDDLPQEQQLALAYARPEHRPLVEAMLRLDRSLGRSVAQASEPIVGQLRLAWWRDALGATPDKRPQGNPVLDLLSQKFGAGTARLQPLVDGWEALLLAESLDEEAIAPFLAGREAAWLAVALLIDPASDEKQVRTAARRWASGDLLAGLGDADERRAVMDMAKRGPTDRQVLPRSLRPLAVLAALSDRAIARGGQPLLGDRMAALVALRSGMFGR